MPKRPISKNFPTSPTQIFLNFGGNVPTYVVGNHVKFECCSPYRFGVMSISVRSVHALSDSRKMLRYDFASLEPNILKTT